MSGFVAFYLYLISFLIFLSVFLLFVRLISWQKSRDASNPSILVTNTRTARCQPAGMQNQPSVFVTPVSMAHMPAPPPKYEYEFAPPPKYEEVVGIHSLQEPQSAQLPPATAATAAAPVPRSDPSMA